MKQDTKGAVNNNQFQNIMLNNYGTINKIERMQKAIASFKTSC